MNKYFLNCSIILSLCYSRSVLAMEHYEEDLRKSKTKSLMTNSTLEDLKTKKMGTMTLCFKKQEPIIPLIKRLGYKGYDHAALVFELFHPIKNSDALTLLMIHWSRPDWCSDSPKICIESSIQALQKIYRGKHTDTTKTVEQEPVYERYGSWLIPNDDLIKALALAENDKNNASNLDIWTCVGYVQKIMQGANLKINIDCCYWLPTPDNLRFLVDHRVEPKPDYSEKKNNFPKFSYTTSNKKNRKKI